MGSMPPEETGFRIVGAHTDSPGFRLKPNPESQSAGLTTLAVEVYGGPILATWFDRDLGLAGRLVVRGEHGVEVRSFRLSRPVCRIATPAIHLNRKVNKEGFRIDREKHLPVIIGGAGKGLEHIRTLASAAAGADGMEVLGLHLELYDLQPAALGGAGGELILAGRIDNLAMCHASLAGLVGAGTSKATKVVCLFNSEEVGSSTLNGAGSNLLESVLERICPGREELLRALASSIQVSADGAHAVHPNWSDRHDSRARPVINGGPVIKVNAQERYTSTADTSAYFGLCAERAGVEVQHFVSRNDMPCGSTIGPITASGLGIQSVDVGNPMLSMHSVREMAGSADQEDMTEALRVHLEGTVPAPADWKRG
jgi:aspartyl aminopeptidase